MIDDDSPSDLLDLLDCYAALKGNLIQVSPRAHANSFHGHENFVTESCRREGFADFKTPIGIRVQQQMQQLWFSRSCRGHQNYASTFCGHKTTAVQVALIVIFSGEGSGAHLSKSSPSQNFNLPVNIWLIFG